MKNIYLPVAIQNHPIANRIRIPAPKKPKLISIPPEFEKELQFGPDELLRSGSLKGILFFFSNYTQDKVHIEYFVLAIGNFYEPRNFMQAMKEILASDSIDKLKLSIVESRMANIFKRWNTIFNGPIKSYKSKISHEMNAFKTFLISENPSLSSFLVDATKRTDEEEEVFFPLSKIPPDPEDFMSFSPVEIARQFCLIVNAQYKSLKISQLHKLRFLNSETSPSIGTMIHFSNVMVNTLSKLISLSNVQNQPKVIKKIINIGKNLLMFENYHSLMWIFLTLNSPEISPLTRSFKLVGYGYAKKVSIKEKIDSTLSPHLNYSGYRHLIDGSSPYILPSLEISILDLSDLLKEENFLDSSGLYDHINVDKMNSMGKIISAIVKAQESVPRFAEEQDIKAYFMGKVTESLTPENDQKREPIKIAESIRKKIKLNPPEIPANMTSSDPESLSSMNVTKTHRSKTLSYNKSFVQMYQTVLDNCVEKKAFIAYLQKNYEYDYYLLYSLICSFEQSKEENQRFKLMEEIFVDFLGFEGGDKRVVISAPVIKEIIVSKPTNLMDCARDNYIFSGIKKELISLLDVMLASHIKAMHSNAQK